MYFDNSYYENDVREGFFIPGMVKRSWAMQLEVLKVIADICKVEGIKWFAFCGTLLGAVRHRGFIPWDDDLDICMLRGDYDRFLLAARERLPKTYKLLSLETEPEYGELFARVTCGDKIDISNDYLNKNHGFPYVAGIDVFPLDHIPSDENKENEYWGKLQKLLLLFENLIKDSRNENEKISEIEHISGFPFDHSVPLKSAFLRVLQSVIRQYGAEASDSVASTADYIKRRRPVFKFEWYQDQIELPFGNIGINVPIGFSEVLGEHYGNWVIAKRGEGAHNYPFFQSQEKTLKKNNGRILYEYVPELQEEKEKKEIWNDNYKQYSGVIENIKNICEVVSYLRREVMYVDIVTVKQLIEKCQEIAIYTGETIEQQWGERTSTIAGIETVCELLYQIYNLVGTNNNELVILCESIEKVAFDVEDTFRTLMNKKRVLFTIARKQDCKYIERIISDKIEDKSCYINYVVLPYIDRNSDGSIHELHYEQDVRLGGIEAINYEVVANTDILFDELYFQHPFDEFESGFSIEPHFYVGELGKKAKQIIYVHSLDVFNVSDELSKKNAYYYVVSPGVISADKILVPSEEIYALYIEILKKNNLSRIAKKIYIDSRICFYPFKRLGLIDRKKIIVYFGIDEILGEQVNFKTIMEKISVINDFSDKMEVYWGVDKCLDEGICRIIDRMKRTVKEKAKFEVAFESVDSIVERIETIDAYYGSGGYLLNLCVRYKIPVMMRW